MYPDMDTATLKVQVSISIWLKHILFTTQHEHIKVFYVTTTASR